MVPAHSATSPALGTGIRTGRMTTTTGHFLKGDSAATLAGQFGSAVRSLQFKATALVVVLTLSVTAIVSGYLLESSGEFARQEHDAQMVSSAAVLARAAGVAFTTKKLDDLKALAIESANGQPLLYVIISDEKGNQLAVAEHRNSGLLQTLHRNEAERVPVPGTPVVHAGGQDIPVYLDVAYPITVRDDSAGRSDIGQPGKLVGYVRTGMKANQWHQSMASRLDLVIGVGILATVAAIPLGFLLIRKIVTPLEGLSEAMDRFSQGKLDVRSPVIRQDEIGKLAEAFNRMADQHQQTHERIVRLNTELEERVAYRTQQLRELASREPLTGVFNRRYFNDMLERRFAEASRYGTDLSCIMMDLDAFKAANDAFGHQVGDELLVLTAGTIVGQLRSADVAARFGGDEFVILLPQTDAERAQVLAERIVERFTQDLNDRFPHVRVSMSMGIASLQMLEPKNADSLIRHADRALYDAKAAGKNRIVIAGQSPQAAAH